MNYCLKACSNTNCHQHTVTQQASTILQLRDYYGGGNYVPKSFRLSSTFSKRKIPFLLVAWLIQHKILVQKVEATKSWMEFSQSFIWGAAKVLLADKRQLCIPLLLYSAYFRYLVYSVYSHRSIIFPIFGFNFC